MGTNLTVVVAGIPAMVDALTRTGQFARVLPVGSTAGLRDLLASGTLSRGTADKVFLFSDRTPVDTEQSLPFLITRLVAMGTPVIVVASSPLGRDLVAQCPGAGLLEGPVKVNQVLGALSGHKGLPSFAPDPNNADIALPGMPAPAPAPAVAAPAADLFGTPTPAQNPFGTPAPALNPFAQAPAPGPSAPTAPAPSSTGFGSAVALDLPTGPRPAPSPANPFGAPVPEPRPSFAPQAPVSLPVAPTPAPAPAPSPFTAPAVVELPTAQPNPFGAPAGAGLAPSPFTTPTQSPQPSPSPAQPGPFGAGATTPVPSPFSSTPTPQPSPFDAPAPQRAQTALATSSPFDTARPAPDPFGGQPTPSQFGQFGQGTGALSPFGESSPPARSAFAMRQDATPAPTRQRRGFVMVVSAPKGGTGKSSMSMNLAAYLGLRLRTTGRNVCLIDGNIQQADIAKYLNEYTPTVEALAKDPSAISVERINDFLVHKPQLNMSVLLGPTTPDVANPNYFSGAMYSDIIDVLRSLYDYIIIDTPVAELYHHLFQAVLPKADFITMVLTPNVTTLMNADLYLQEITKPVNVDGMGIDRRKIGIVLNRAEDDIGVDEEEVRRELSAWRFLASVPETKEWKRCNNNNQLVAPLNYHELNQAFSAVLAGATGEDLLVSPTLPAASGRGGLLKKFFGGKR